MKNNFTQEIDQICKWIQHRCAGFNGCVLGLSGGLDSVVVAALCARAGVSTHVLVMPARASTNANMSHAEQIIAQFNLKASHINIANIVDSFAASLLASQPQTPESGNNAQNAENTSESRNCVQNNSVSRFCQQLMDISPIRYGNLCARTRMSLLYDYSAEHGLLVAGTSNLSERLLGYFTLWGDMACAFNPIGEFYKSELKQMARELGISEEIISKPPSADFYDEQSDEADLGFSYEQIDEVLKAHLAGEQVDERYHSLLAKVAKNRFKLEPICIYKRKQNECK